MSTLNVVCAKALGRANPKKASKVKNLMKMLLGLLSMWSRQNQNGGHFSRVQGTHIFDMASDIHEQRFVVLDQHWVGNQRLVLGLTRF